MSDRLQARLTPDYPDSQQIPSALVAERNDRAPARRICGQGLRIGLTMVFGISNSIGCMERLAALAVNAEVRETLLYLAGQALAGHCLKLRPIQPGTIPNTDRTTAAPLNRRAPHGKGSELRARHSIPSTPTMRPARNPVNGRRAGAAPRNMSDGDETN